MDSFARAQGDATAEVAAVARWRAGYLRVIRQHLVEAYGISETARSWATARNGTVREIRHADTSYLLFSCWPIELNGQPVDAHVSIFLRYGSQPLNRIYLDVDFRATQATDTALTVEADTLRHRTTIDSVALGSDHEDSQPWDPAPHVVYVLDQDPPLAGVCICLGLCPVTLIGDTTCTVEVVPPPARAELVRADVPERMQAALFAFWQERFRQDQERLNRALTSVFEHPRITGSAASATQVQLPEASAPAAERGLLWRLLRLCW